MARAFSVASWNVEHFGALQKKQGNSSRRRRPRKPVQPIIDFLAGQNADVVAVFEVESSVVFRPLVEAMPNHQFHITEGRQTQEILVGIKKGFSAFVTQRLEFKSGQTSLRPGVLVAIVVDGAYYPIVFLHLKSLREPKGFGLRDDMTQRAIDFRKVLDRASGGSGSANYIFVGDLNTMGMNLTYSNKDVSGEEEIRRLKKRTAASSIGMRVLDKNCPNTYWAGTNASHGPGDLDHVVAAKHLQFKSFEGAPIDVRGWPQEEPDEAKDAWADKYSDHALLYFEVQKV